MLTAISRYGARVIPNTEQTIAALARPRRAHRGPHDRRVRAGVRGRLGARHARQRLVRPDGVLLPAEGARAAAGIGDHLPGADVLGRCRSWRASRAWCRCSPTSIRARSRSIRPRSSGRSRRARAPWCRRISTACRATWTRSCDRPAPQPRGDRGLRARARRDVPRPAGRHIRRRRVLQLPDAQAAEHVRRRHGGRRAIGGRARASRRWSRRSRWPTRARLRRLRLGRVQRICDPSARVHARRCFPMLLGAARSCRPTRTSISGRRSGRSTRCPPSYRRALQQRAGGDRSRSARHLDAWTGGAVAHAHAFEEALGGSADRHARRAGRNARTSSTNTRSTRRSGTRWCGAACGAAWTSRPCTSTCARGCRSSGPATRPRRAPSVPATAIQLPVYSSLTRDGVRARRQRSVREVVAAP